MRPASAALSLLVFAAATHFLVDAVAGTLNPLWPRLDPHFRLAAWQNGALYFIWQMTTSVSQFFFGLYGDRFNARWLLWAGPAAAIVCLGSIGLTHSPLVLANLLFISGLGIAAFHPEAAALAGSCAPQHRSRAMSVFTMGGFLGQAVGPIYSGNVVDRHGLAGLSWGIAVGLAAVAALWPLARGKLGSGDPIPTTGRHSPPSPFRRAERSSLMLVLVIGSLRIISAAGVPVLTGFLLAAREASASDTGTVQAAFMIGIGLGGMACAVLLRQHHERLILWLCPLAAAPILVALPWTGGVVLAAMMCLCGLLLGISLPVLISFGQQLLPHSQRIASSITMGVSWGLGGAIVSVILAACRYADWYEPAFVVFGGTAAVSSALCMWLPAASQLPGSRFQIEGSSNPPC